MALRILRSPQDAEDALQETFEVPRFEDLCSRELVDWGVEPIRKLLTVKMQEKIEAAIDKPPAKYRVVFVLRDLEGFSKEEESNVIRFTAGHRSAGICGVAAVAPSLF
ncbi:MAG: RNA polymerase sigma factor [bacterium]